MSCNLLPPEPVLVVRDPVLMHEFLPTDEVREQLSMLPAAREGSDLSDELPPFPVVTEALP
eukprot:8552633-Alexandrium_andersonii.AAC.1